MSTNAKIKVIKKGTKAEPVQMVEKKTSKQAAREMVSTVTNWVTEFQQKRRTETKQAIENLFGTTAQTDGCR
jgi:uncharacterized membrane-anchored protein